VRSRVTPPALACIAVLFAAAARTPAALAQPSIRIRAESRIEVRATWSETRLHVQGHLRDDLAAPLANAPVEVRVQPREGGPVLRRSVRTGDDGALDARFEVPPGAYRLSAAYGGDGHHERVEVERELDASRAEVRLRVSVPNEGRLRLDEAQHEIAVRVESEAPVAGLRVRLTDELGRALGALQADRQGEARFRVAASQLGPASAGRIVARTEADAQRSDALTEVPILRVAPTRVSLAVSDRRPVRGVAIRAQGRLVDFSGRPLGREAILVLAGSAPLTTTLTDGEGRFDVRVVPPGEGATTLRARFESDAPWRLPGESAPVELDVVGAGRTSTRWVFGTLLATTALLAAFGLRGRRALPRMSRPPERAPTSGVELGTRRFRADRLDVDGTVKSLRDGSPLAGARVLLRRAGQDDATVTCVSDARGSFTFTANSAGPHAIEITAAEHESLTRPLTLPHRGEWSAALVKLERTRDRALDALAPVARALLPERPAGTTTPRELREAAHERALPEPPAKELTEGAERAGYAPTPPTDAELRALEEARDAMLAVLARKPGARDERR
jgi:hypothetical protein